MGTLANSGDAEESMHNAVFHQGLQFGRIVSSLDCWNHASSAHHLKVLYICAKFNEDI